MDADLQHDETLLPMMLDVLRSERADLVVGSRNVEGSSGHLSRRRQGISRLATFVASKLLGINFADPMSGFFMMRRQAFEQIAPRLSVQGFKILLDIAASARNSLRIVEIPYNFRSRKLGVSKLDSPGHARLCGVAAIEADRRPGFAPISSVRAGRINRTGRAFCDPVHCALYDQSRLLDIAGDRVPGRDVRKFHFEQPLHVSRSKATRVRIRARPASILRHLRDRRGCQCRNCYVGFF